MTGFGDCASLGRDHGGGFAAPLDRLPQSALTLADPRPSPGTVLLHQPITDTQFGQQNAWPGRINLDLFA
jgi:hypothetical protein